MEMDLEPLEHKPMEEEPQEPLEPFVIKISSQLWKKERTSQPRLSPSPSYLDVDEAEFESLEDGGDDGEGERQILTGVKRRLQHGYACPNCGAKVGFNAKKCRTCTVDLTLIRSCGSHSLPTTPDLIQDTSDIIELEQTRKHPKHGCKHKSGRPMKRQALTTEVYEELESSTSTSRFSIDEDGDDRLAFLQNISEILPESILSSQVVCCASQRALSGISSMSYRELIRHLISLRMEQQQRMMRPVLQKLMLHPHNQNLFNVPVNPDLMGIPDYFDRIKNPMDLGTVKSKLLRGDYQNKEACASDIRLVFENACTYNPVTHMVHECAKVLQNEFEAEMVSVEEKLARDSERKNAHSCTLCNGTACQMCGEKCLKFESPMLVCNGTCGQKIKRNAVYYVVRDGSRIWCHKCYGGLSPTIEFGVVGGTRVIRRRDLLKRKFDEEVSEPWVQCEQCNCWVHQICALFNERCNTYPNPAHEPGSDSDITTNLSKPPCVQYTCPLCTLEMTSKRFGFGGDIQVEEFYSPAEDDPSPKRRKQEPDANLSIQHDSANIWRASSLPLTKLASFLEEHVKHALNMKGFSVDAQESLCIRMVSNIEQFMEVPEIIRSNLKASDNMCVPQFMPYKSKCILMFQRVEGVDICLFSLYVQEFDNSCPEPNKGRVYIAYLDSVEYFRPREARTLVYHEILVGYLAWAKARGFSYAHIWACPPQRGDNFIFWVHPPHQRTPSRDRLNAWYDEVIKRAKESGVVEQVRNLYDEFFVPYNRRFKEGGEWLKELKRCERTRAGDRTPVCPPVFEGDFWVNECHRVFPQVQTRARGLDGTDPTVNHRKCRDIIKSLNSHRDSAIFNEPVNIYKLGILDYFTIIRRPMDLGTVKNFLREGKYSNMLEFAEDVRLTYTNAMTYNPPMHIIHKAAAAHLKEFEAYVCDIICERVGEVYNVASQMAEINNLLSQYTLRAEDESQQHIHTNIHEGIEDEKSGTVDLSRSPLHSHVHEDDCCSTDQESKDDENAQPRTQTDTTNPQEGTSVQEDTQAQDDTDTKDGAEGTPAIERQVSSSSIQSEAPSLDWLPYPSMKTNPSLNTEPKKCVCVPFDKPVLGIRGSLELMFEISKAVQRLKEDLFVLCLAPNPRVKTNPKRVRNDGDIGMITPIMVESHSETVPVPPTFRLMIEAGQLSSSALEKCMRVCVADTSDPDPCMECPLLDLRHTFLEMSQYRHYQWDTLRRAKHSAQMLLYHLHNPKLPNLRPQCALCMGVCRSVRWHCDLCMNYDLCEACYSKGQHVHSHPSSHILTPFRVTFE